MSVAFDIAAAHVIEQARRDPIAFVELIAKVSGDRYATCSGEHARWQRLVSEQSRVVLFAGVGLGKTLQIARWRLLWELGRNPNLRVAIVSSSETHGQKILSGIRTDVEHSLWLREVFPELRPSTTQELWRTDAVRFERSDPSNDPSITVIGAGSSEIQGSRLDLVIVDDLCTFANSLTANSRDKIYDWPRASVLTRGTPTGMRVWVLANPWQYEDAAHRLSTLPGWTAVRCPVVNDSGALTVPEVACARAIEIKEAELGPVYADSMLRVKTPKSGQGLVSAESIEKCLQNGRGLDFVDEWDPQAAPTYAGVDVGGGGKRSDLSSIFVFAVLADGCRRILSIDSGQWDGRELVSRLRETYRRYGCLFAVETNGTQSLLADLVAELPVHRHVTTAQNKHAPGHGVMGISLELEAGSWIIPATLSGDPANTEVREWISELVTYSPTSHMGDRLAASWFARELAREAFSVLDDYAGAAEAEERWLHEQYGILPSPEERAFQRRGCVGWFPLNHLGDK